MSRLARAVVAASVVAGSGAMAAADDSEAVANDREIAATLGVASGGRVTAGGLRLGGRFLYQMSADDWFEGHAAFTFGSGAQACFRDRDDVFLCDHGPIDGVAGEIGISIRRRLAVRGPYQPFVRVGLAARAIRFGDDGVYGVAFPAIAAAGVKVAVSDSMSVGAEAALEFGFGWFDHGLGTEPQLGLAVAALVEFAL